MNVQNTVGKRLDKGTAQQPHEPGQTDQPDVAAAELGDQRLVIRLARRVGSVLQHHGLDARPARPRETTRVHRVGDDHRNGRQEPTGSHRIDNRLQVAAATGDEDAESSVHRGDALSPSLRLRTWQGATWLATSLCVTRNFRYARLAVPVRVLDRRAPLPDLANRRRTHLAAADQGC